MSFGSRGSPHFIDFLERIIVLPTLYARIMRSHLHYTKGAIVGYSTLLDSSVRHCFNSLSNLKFDFLIYSFIGKDSCRTVGNRLLLHRACLAAPNEADSLLEEKDTKLSSIYNMWGSSGFAVQRNLKKICYGTRNSSYCSAEQRNFPPLLKADFLENDKRNTEFSCNLMDFVENSSVVFVFHVSFMRIFSMLCTRIYLPRLFFPPGWMKMSNITNLYHHLDNEVAGRGTLAINERNGGFSQKIARNGGFLPPPPLMTPTSNMFDILFDITICLEVHFIPLKTTRKTKKRKTK